MSMVDSAWDGHQERTVDEWRRDYESRYDASGRPYEEYAPHYRWGFQHGQSEKFRGRTWEEAERELQRDWIDEFRTDWEEFKDAVRRGWESLTGRQEPGGERRAA